MYEFYIDGERLPVTPSEISISHGTEIETVDLANGHKITRWIGPELRTVSFKATFPKSAYASYIFSGLRTPEWYLQYFTEKAKEHDYVELTIYESDDHNMREYDIDYILETGNKLIGYFYIESMTESRSAENGSELEIDFSFLEWSGRKTTVIETSSSVFGTIGKWNEIVVDAQLQRIFDVIDSFEEEERPTPIKESSVPKYITTPKRTPLYTASQYTYQSLAREHYKDISKANYIRSLQNESLKKYGLTQNLPYDTQIRIK